MSWVRRNSEWAALAAALVLLIVVIAWRLVFLPSAMAFAGGNPVSLAQYQGRSPTGVPPELESADRVTRGRYLAEAADCQACHTVPGGTPYAGGRAFKLPFGTIYTPNITPDNETGIGAWTDADFLKAVHEGKRPDGQRLYPAFPYASYALMTDDDVLAIRAYLSTLPPVRNENMPNTFGFPFNQRWLMVFWSAFYNPGERFRPIPERGDEWNRGAYLVEAAAHCGECHTPRNLMQARDTRNKFAGGAAEGWNAYNITSDRISGIGDWSPEALAQYLREGHAPGHGVASGPMDEAVRLSLSKMTPGDIAAMVTYLQSIPPVRTRAAPAMAAAAPVAAGAGPQDNPLGKRIFEGACASCHAWSGAGALTADAQFTGNRAVNDRTAANVALMVINGIGRPTAGRAYMPAFGHAYSDREVAAVANYVTARFGSEPSEITAKDVAGLRED